MDNLRINAKRNRFELRLSTYELEELRLKTKARGFATVSALLRHMALKHDIVMETKIIETNKIVRELLDIIKEKNNQPK